MWWLSRPNLFSKPKPIAAIELEADCRVRAAKLAATSRVPSTAQGWVKMLEYIAINHTSGRQAQV